MNIHFRFCLLFQMNFANENYVISVFVVRGQLIFRAKMLNKSKVKQLRNNHQTR